MIKLVHSLRMIPVLLAAAAVLASCSGDQPTDPGNGNDTVSVPSAYAFTSRFDASKSSVDYPGQVVRNLLIQDLSARVSALAKPGAVAVTEAELLAYYEHDDASAMTTLTTTGSLPVLEGRYAQIATGKKLSDKIASTPVGSTGATPDALIRGWISTIAANSNDPSKLGTPAVYTDSLGRDLSQMLNKLLLGAVAYHQATGVYMAGVLDKNNTSPAAGSGGAALPFTAMEHAWDEAFGYFGAARDYARYSDAALSGGVADYTYDTDADGKIDLAAEYNYAFARNAGKRDAGANGTDLTADVFRAFLRGRTAIANQGTRAAIEAERLKAVGAWEKVIAATVIHYINAVKSDMAELTAESGAHNSAELNKHWAEMKAYAWALGFNPFAAISSTDLQTVHRLMTESPLYAPAGSVASSLYIESLDQARAILQSTYGFSASNVQNW